VSLATLALHALLASRSLLAAPASCAVSGETRAPSDVTSATRACEVARARFGDLLGTPVPDVEIVLWNEVGYRTGVRGGNAVVYWPTGKTLAAVRRDGEFTTYGNDPWSDGLPHEISHVLLAARFFGAGAGASAGQGAYGTPLPDWLDEAVAIWAEPARSRARRMGEARALPDAWLDLDEIMNGPHPGAANPAVMAMRDGGAPPSDEALAAFYPRSLALLGFVYDLGGSVGVQRLVRSLLEDGMMGARALQGLPGMPDDPATTRAAWKSWLDGSAKSAAAR
jgi:hypothetical protein